MEEKPLPKLQLTWKASGEKNFRQTYGKGSRSTTKREKKKVQALQAEAKKSLSIQDVWKRAAELGLGKKDKDSNTEKESLLAVSTPLVSLRRGYLFQTGEMSPEMSRDRALNDLNHLLSHPTKQIEKYGQVLPPNSNFLRRHDMVLGLLCIQKRKANYPRKTGRQFATIVANVDDWGESTAQSLIRWKKSWIKDRIIPQSEAGKHKHNFSWMEDEDLILDIWAFTKASKDGSIINHL